MIEHERTPALPAARLPSFARESCIDWIEATLSRVALGRSMLEFVRHNGVASVLYPPGQGDTFHRAATIHVSMDSAWGAVFRYYHEGVHARWYKEGRGPDPRVDSENSFVYGKLDEEAHVIAETCLLWVQYCDQGITPDERPAGVDLFMAGYRTEQEAALRERRTFDAGAAYRKGLIQIQVAMPRAITVERELYADYYRAQYRSFHELLAAGGRSAPRDELTA